MGDKYELSKKYIEMDGKKLFRVRALANFRGLKVGELGGYVESGKISIFQLVSQLVWCMTMLLLKIRRSFVDGLEYIMMS